MYQLATEHQGVHFLARCSIWAGVARRSGVSLVVGLRPKYVRAKPLRMPKSEVGRTLGRPRRKMSIISTVHLPIPRTWVRWSMMA